MIMAFYKMTVLDKESEQLVLDVIAGNPGACEMVCLLLSSPLWHPILHALRAQNLVGSQLWQVIHDDYADDWEHFIPNLLNVGKN
jgi:hypothetical protein